MGDRILVFLLTFIAAASLLMATAKLTNALFGWPAF